jgi:outer membrane protein TolC
MSQSRRIKDMPILRLLPAFALLIALPTLAQERLTFDEFLNQALAQNLQLKIESAKSQATHANAKALNIPPPMVGYMSMTDQSGSSASGFEISQSIPFPTKISSDHSARKFEAAAQDESRMAAEAEIRAKAKVLFTQLWISQQRENALREKKSIIESHIKLSRAEVRSDSFLRIHLLKAESDRDLLENEILAADQLVLESRAEAANFLNIDVATFHPALEEPPLTEIPEEKTLASPHQLEAARLMFESFKAQESEAKSDWFPDLNLRYREIGQTQLMPKTSEITIGISVPFIFPWDVSAKSGAASGQRLQSQLVFEREKRTIDSERTVLIEKARSLRKQLDLITQKLLPRAEKRMKIVHNLAPRDMETLQDHRETMEAFPDLKLKALDLRGQYEAAVGKLMKYQSEH